MSKTSPRKKTRVKATKLTVKERQFLKEYASSGNGTSAARKVYAAKNNNSAHSLANKMLNKPKIAEALQVEMSRQGITLEKIIKPVARALDAKDFNGDEDIKTQLMGHDRAIKLLGVREKSEEKPEINFNINKAQFGGEFVKDEK